MAIGTLAAIGLGSAVLGAGASAVGAAKNSSAINKATNANQQATNQSLALQEQTYNRNQNALEPYMRQGNTATNILNGLYGIGGDQSTARDAFSDWLANSNYSFQQQQGGNALNSGYAGAGTVQSGAAMKALEEYRQNLQQGYRSEFTNNIIGQQQMGLSGASALAGVSQNYANNATNLNMANAQNIGNAAVAGANNTNALLGSLGGFASNILGGLSARPGNDLFSRINNRPTYEMSGALRA